MQKKSKSVVNFFDNCNCPFTQLSEIVVINSIHLNPQANQRKHWMFVNSPKDQDLVRHCQRCGTSIRLLVLVCDLTTEDVMVMTIGLLAKKNVTGDVEVNPRTVRLTIPTHHQVWKHILTRLHTSISCASMYF